MAVLCATTTGDSDVLLDGLDFSVFLYNIVLPQLDSALLYLLLVPGTSFSTANSTHSVTSHGTSAGTTEDIVTARRQVLLQKRPEAVRQKTAEKH